MSQSPLAAMPFATLIGAELVSASPAEVRGRVEWTPDRCTTGGVLHGGVLMSLADALGGYCAVLNLQPGVGTATIESKTNFFRAVRAGFVDGVTTPIHVGRTTIVLQTDLLDQEGRLVARVTQTQLVIPPAAQAVPQSQLAGTEAPDSQGEHQGEPHRGPGQKRSRRRV